MKKKEEHFQLTLKVDEPREGGRLISLNDSVWVTGNEMWDRKLYWKN